MATNSNNPMTYKTFAEKIIDLLNDLACGDVPAIPDAELTALIDKANALYTRETTKAEKTKERTSKKPANPVTNQIMGVLTDSPMTGAEIAVAVGDVSLTALQVSNALQRAITDGTVISEKVERQVMGNGGKAVKRKYTAYRLA